MVNKSELIACTRTSDKTKELLKRENKMVSNNQREINFTMRMKQIVKPK